MQSLRDFDKQSSIKLARLPDDPDSPGYRVFLLTPYEEDQIASDPSLAEFGEDIVDLEFFLKSAQNDASGDYSGHLQSMIECISNAVERAVNILKDDIKSIIGIDDFIGRVTEEIKKARTLAYPNRCKWDDSWAELSDQIDSHLDNLRTFAQDIKAQRVNAAQERPALAQA